MVKGSGWKREKEPRDEKKTATMETARTGKRNERRKSGEEADARESERDDENGGRRTWKAKEVKGEDFGKAQKKHGDKGRETRLKRGRATARAGRRAGGARAAQERRQERRRSRVRDIDRRFPLPHLSWPWRLLPPPPPPSTPTAPLRHARLAALGRSGLALAPTGTRRSSAPGPRWRPLRVLYLSVVLLLPVCF